MNRLVLSSVAVLGLLASGVQAAEAPSPDSEKIHWLSEHAVPVRLIVPENEDFSDLMPLVQWIGGSRVVALGEVTHGDGAMFLAKTRLVRFLHEVMGFDVLAWEAGFFDVPLVDAALRSQGPLPEPGLQ
jgi:erythromycin esterase